MSSAVDRYWCHTCNAQLNNVLPDFKCPTCSGGFIELMTEGEDDVTYGQPTEHSFQTDMLGLLSELLSGARNRGSTDAATSDAGSTGITEPTVTTTGEDTATTDTASASGASTSTFRNQPGQRFRRGRNYAIRGSRGGVLPGGQPTTSVNFSFPMNDSDDQTPVPLGFLQQVMGPLFSQLISGGEGGVGNTGDYIMFDGQLDNFITQLLDSSSVGPPPASKDEIKAMVKDTNVTAQDVEKEMQCTVCMDFYSLGEKVKQIPCGHKYHEDCILPWLDLHGTCPVCRITLSGEEPTFQEERDDAPRNASSRPSASSSATNATVTRDSSELNPRDYEFEDVD